MLSRCRWRASDSTGSQTYQGTKRLQARVRGTQAGTTWVLVNVGRHFLAMDEEDVPARTAA